MELDREIINYLKANYGGKKYLQKNDFEGLFKDMKSTYYIDNKAEACLKLLEFLLVQAKLNVFDYMKSIPESCFFNSTSYRPSLTQLDINGKVTRIGNQAFANNKWLKKVVIGDNVELIDKNAFLGCSSLSSVHLGDSVTVIRDGAFADTALKHIYLPESVTMLGNKVFPENCYLVSPKRKRKSLRFPKREMEWYREHLVLDPRLNMTATETEEPVVEEN